MTPSAKSIFLQEIIPALGEKAAYYSLSAIRDAVKERRLALSDGSLKVYLSEAVRQGGVHNAGRDWYSRLSDRIMLDLEDLDDSISLTGFSLDEFRQDLLNFLQAHRAELERAPLGLFAVVPPAAEIPMARPGVIFCLRQKEVNVVGAARPGSSDR